MAPVSTPAKRLCERAEARLRHIRILPIDRHEGGSWATQLTGREDAYPGKAAGESGGYFLVPSGDAQVRHFAVP